MEARKSKMRKSWAKHMSHTMKHWRLIVEYRHLSRHFISGCYVLPDKQDIHVWHGVLFLRQGMYKGGVFRFKITFSHKFPDVDEPPTVQMLSDVFHPFICRETGIVNFSNKFPVWISRNFVVELLVYLRNMFYPKETEFENPESINNREACALFKEDRAAFQKEAERSACESVKTRYACKEGSIVFSKPRPHAEAISQIILKKEASPGKERRSFLDFFNSACTTLRERPGSVS